MKVGALIVTHVGHRRFLKVALQSVQKIGIIPIVCAYNVNNEFGKLRNFDTNFPALDIMALANRWLFLYSQRMGWSWFNLATNGMNLLKLDNLDYILFMEGDCVINKPENFDMVLDKLNEYDLFLSEKKGDGYAGTALFVGKAQKVFDCFDLMAKNALCDISGVEGRFGCVIRELKLLTVPIENPIVSQLSVGYRGTLGELLGFNHLHGCEKWRKYHHHSPLSLKFYDERYVQEFKILKEYHNTKNKEVLFKSKYWEEKAIDDEKYIKEHEEESD